MEKFYYCSKDVQAGTLQGVVKYTLNRAAGAVTIRFFDHNLDEFQGSALTGQPTDAGSNWSDVYTLTGVEFDQNEEPVGPIYCVLFAEESAEDAAENRDGLAKPALQKGSTNLQYTPVGLEQVSFASASGESNWHTVQADFGGNTYSPPQWQDNSRPLDGDADDGEEFSPGADHKYPVCYRWDSALNASCVIWADPMWGQLEQGQVFVRGDGDGNLDFPVREAQVTPGTPPTVTYPATNTSGDLPALVQRIGAFDVAWEISTDEGTTWHYAGTSENEVFVYRPAPQGDEPPGCDPDFRTVLYLATVNGGTDADTCLANTWTSFSGPRDVCAWNPTAKEYSRDLYYYLNHIGGDPGPPPVFYTTAVQLLLHGHGQCHAWADLFKESLLANNVGNVERIRVLPPVGYKFFGVKNIAFDGADPWWPGEPVWKYAVTAWDADDREIDDLDITVTGIPGQNMNPPFAKLFGQHFIVHRTGDATYYDPSYGVTTTGAAAYTAEAIDAWSDEIAGQQHWCKESAVQQHVRFNPEPW